MKRSSQADYDTVYAKPASGAVIVNNSVYIEPGAAVTIIGSSAAAYATLTVTLGEIQAECIIRVRR